MLWVYVVYILNRLESHSERSGLAKKIKRNSAEIPTKPNADVSNTAMNDYNKWLYVNILVQKYD